MQLQVVTCRAQMSLPSEATARFFIAPRVVTKRSVRYIELKFCFTSVLTGVPEVSEKVRFVGQILLCGTKLAELPWQDAVVDKFIQSQDNESVSSA